MGEGEERDPNCGQDASWVGIVASFMIHVAFERACRERAAKREVVNQFDASGETAATPRQNGTLLLPRGQIYNYIMHGGSQETQFASFSDSIPEATARGLDNPRLMML